MIIRNPRRAVVWQRAVLSITIVILLAGTISAFYHMTSLGSQTSGNTQVPSVPKCKGAAACFSNKVTYIVDGDTLDIGNTRIRLALVNTPEVGESGYALAKYFTARTCPVGTQAFVDEDDRQTGSSYGRMVAVVYCTGVNLNAALLDSGDAELVRYYCSVSEFAREAWTGCP